MVVNAVISQPDMVDVLVVVQSAELPDMELQETKKSVMIDLVQLELDDWELL